MTPKEQALKALHDFSYTHDHSALGGVTKATSEWLMTNFLMGIAATTDFISNHIDLYESPGGRLMDIGFHFIQVFFS